MFSKQISSIGDEEYIHVFANIIRPIIQEFDPNLFIVSAGYDSGYGDLLGNLNLRPRGFAYMTDQLKRLCPKLVLVLEGGYSKDTLASCSEACVRALLGEKLPYKQLGILDSSFEEMELKCQPKEFFTQKAELGLISLLKSHWKCMAQLYQAKQQLIQSSVSQEDL